MMKLDPRTLLYFTILSIISLALTACTMTQQLLGDPEEPYPPAVQPAVGDIYHLPTGIRVSLEQMTAAAADTRIIYVGETHDNPAAHRLELQVLKAAATSHPGQVSLGMEMFNTEQQQALDRWVAGELTEKEFLKQVAWHENWRMDYAYYRDILNYARAHGIRVIGINATKEMVKQVGGTPLNQLDEKTRSQLPEFDLEDPYQRALTEAIYAGHSQGAKMLDGFLRVQTLWDETMAMNVVRELADKGPDHRMVVMAGGNHIRFGFGIPRRVYRRMPTSYTLIGSREIVIPEEKQDSLMNVEPPHFPMPPYDYLQYTEYESLPGERVKLGVKINDTDGRVVVEGVVPGSPADKAGVKSGDVIKALGEASIDDNFDLIYQVNQQVSGDQTSLTIERGEERITLQVIFSPLPKGAEHGMGARPDR